MKTEQEVIEILRSQADGGRTMPMRDFLLMWSSGWAGPADGSNADYYMNAARIALINLPGGIDAWECLVFNDSSLWCSHDNTEDDDRGMLDAFGDENFIVDTSLPIDKHGRLQFKALSAFYASSQDDYPLVSLVPTTRPEFMVMADDTNSDGATLFWLHRIA